MDGMVVCSKCIFEVTQQKHGTKVRTSGDIINVTSLVVYSANIHENWIFSLDFPCRGLPATACGVDKTLYYRINVDKLEELCNLGDSRV